jgi:hypothetical protein
MSEQDLSTLKVEPPKMCDEYWHVWLEPMRDGDTCQCGRLYLTLHSAREGVAAEVDERV